MKLQSCENVRRVIKQIFRDKPQNSNSSSFVKEYKKCQKSGLIIPTNPFTILKLQSSCDDVPELNIKFADLLTMRLKNCERDCRKGLPSIFPISFSNEYARQIVWEEVTKMPEKTFRNPTDNFTILEPHHPSNNVSELHKVRPSPDFEAPKL